MKNRKILVFLSVVAVILLSTAVYYKFVKEYLPEIQISEKSTGVSGGRNLTLAENIIFLKTLQETKVTNGIDADDSIETTLVRLRIISVLCSIGIAASLTFLGWLIATSFRRSRHSASPDGKTL